jgi:putative ABC transport system permease protein
MSGHVYLAWRYLAHNRVKTAILVFSIALIVFVPSGLRVLVGRSAEELTARADATPLLIGAQGSPLELTLSSLYFEGESPATVGYDQVERIQETGYAVPIPLHARFHAQGAPIVGTGPEYLEHRGLALADGRAAALLGECVLGAAVARERGLAPGDRVVSSPENVFDLAGVYPLEMNVVGVLAPAFTPDDEAVFVDVKTAWVIEGLGHGHEDLSRPESSAAVLERDGDVITANASVVQYTRITEENADSFHFHGDPAAFPLTAVLAVPHDAKTSALLRGRYQAAGETVQIVRPRDVIDDLLGTVFTVQGYVVAAVVFVGGSTLATTVLVFLLSLRLRRGEIATMIKIGAPKSAVATVLSLEVVLVVAASLLLAGLLTAASARYAPEIVRTLVQS